MSKLQYKLEVKDGIVLVEEGSFFPASPFIVKTEAIKIKVAFSHSKDLRNNDRGEVVYQVFKLEEGKEKVGAVKESLLVELTHPDYAPEIKPGIYKAALELKGEILLACLAMVKLGLIKEKSYKKELALDKLEAKPHPNLPRVDFSLEQEEKILVT